ncbi:hypothetical protein Lepto7376_1751 [[Leptolyngbya] sp. PCC 7376]|uniref:hypothetical protein n=1 Tax=[Leptolyngbya] sp. PCC 7376 TaxID=111781 RepID=UPI00029EFF40|nr:hypothetical protein [[Leptolyngbya] sp. PCC 7376]AFY38084.1 hypothetical protein Lepto7376_1751 [[Leptolyngbya] sp. PCC 7376]
MSAFENFWIGTVIVPLFVILLKKEIVNLYKSWSVFQTRPFDEDRDPSTPDSCQIYNTATGEWNDIFIARYSFSLDKNNRGVFVFHPVDGKLGADKDWAAERIPLLVWADMRKRQMPKPLDSDLEKILESKFSQSTNS